MANPSKLNPNRQDEYASEHYLRRIKAEIRKTNKPIMEKKRRARINNYLNDLKALLLDAMKKDPVRHSKLEKADILDLTVKHLQDIERRRLAVAMAVDPSVPEKFASGYRECIDEIGKYFDSLGSVDEGLKGRVRKHLEGCLAFPARVPFPGGGGVGSFGVPLATPDDVNNNTQGLLNRVFANNLSLGMMLPSARMGFLGGDVPTAMPFGQFPFFGSGLGHAAPSGTFPRSTLDPEVPEVQRGTPRDSEHASSPPTPPPVRRPAGNPDVGLASPPASPSPLGNDSDDPGTTGGNLKTPMAARTDQQHTMERLLTIFPTPPSPEDPQPARRFGKLGYHFDTSPFIPTERTLAMDTSVEDERTHEQDESQANTSTGEEGEHGRMTDTGNREDSQDQPDPPEAGKDNPPNGEMWRPW